MEAELIDFLKSINNVVQLNYNFDGIIKYGYSVKIQNNTTVFINNNFSLVIKEREKVEKILDYLYLVKINEGFTSIKKRIPNLVLLDMFNYVSRSSTFLKLNFESMMNFISFSTKNNYFYD